MRFFSYSSKVSAWNLSDFLHKVIAALKLKIDSDDFYGKKSCCGGFGQKVVQNEFYKFYNKSIYYIFL